MKIANLNFEILLNKRNTQIKVREKEIKKERRKRKILSFSSIRHVTWLIMNLIGNMI